MNVCKMKNILKDSSKFYQVYIDHDQILNHLIHHMENRVTDVLKKISSEQYKDLSPSGSRPGVMYGLAKVHKIVTDGRPSLRLILSAIVTNIPLQETIDLCVEN